MAEVLHVLPLAGGLFDQPGGYITRMEYVLRATAEQAAVHDDKRAAQERLAKRTAEVAVDE